MKRKWRQFSLAGLLFFTAAVALVSWYFSGYMPGTLSFNEFGVPRGTGTRLYHYKSGELKLTEKYRAGKLVRSSWYRPDGSIVAVTEYRNESGEWLLLNEDGSIRAKYQMVNGLANGQATYYRPDGSVERVAHFRSGQEVEPVAPKASRAVSEEAGGRLILNDFK
ncbi:MAG: hypothetical protein WD278_18815 [Pirellulales bacterium]